jgi:hypothetical protein
MGWTCQHDHEGYCKLIKKPCIPGMKGCTLKKNSEGIVFSADLHHESSSKDESQTKEIDFAALARSN